MRYFLLVSLILCSLLLVSCEWTSGPRFEGEVFTLSGLLIAGRPIDRDQPVYLTRSSSIEEFDPWNIFVLDANIRIIDLTDSLDFDLVPVPHEFKVKYIDPTETIIQAGHRYRIEVQVPGSDSLIWAETVVTQTVGLETNLWGTYPEGEGYSLDPDTQNTIVYSEVDVGYPIVLNTGGTQGVFNFLAEIYCREEFSTELEFTNPVFGIVHPDESLEPIYNSTGESMRRILFLGRFSSLPQPELPDNYILVRNYSQAIAFFGRYRVSAYVTDDNYYRYTYMPEGYLHGGVHNALGYFGSASGGVMYARIVK